MFIVCTLSLVAFAFDAFVFSIAFSHADVVGGLLVTSAPHLSVLVYLCNKLVIVVAMVFVYCS